MTMRIHVQSLCHYGQGNGNYACGELAVYNNAA